MEVSVKQSGSNTRTYQFDQPIDQSEMNWLDNHNYIGGYRVEGSTVLITAKPDTDWNRLEGEFLKPGFTKLLGSEVNFKQKTHA